MRKSIRRNHKNQRENHADNLHLYKKIPSEFSLFKKIDIIKPKTIQNEKTFISYIFTV